ncbi:MAG: hypothetical protein LWX56_07825 [Ignavibacteria bacterium]|nr:hypothetical protein [Ignavibacteria bacterium]
MKFIIAAVFAFISTTMYAESFATTCSFAKNTDSYLTPDSSHQRQPERKRVPKEAPSGREEPRGESRNRNNNSSNDDSGIGDCLVSCCTSPEIWGVFLNLFGNASGSDSSKEAINSSGPYVDLMKEDREKAAKNSETHHSKKSMVEKKIIRPQSIFMYAGGVIGMSSLSFSQVAPGTTEEYNEAGFITGAHITSIYKNLFCDMGYTWSSFSAKPAYNYVYGTTANPITDELLSSSATLKQVYFSLGYIFNFTPREYGAWWNLTLMAGIARTILEENGDGIRHTRTNGIPNNTAFSESMKKTLLAPLFGLTLGYSPQSIPRGRFELSARYTGIGNDPERIHSLPLDYMRTDAAYNFVLGFSYNILP